MSKIDRTPDVLAALKKAHKLDNKRDIVIKVLECVKNGFSTLDPSLEKPIKKESDMISREEFVQKINLYIDELKKSMQYDS